MKKLILIVTVFFCYIFSIHAQDYLETVYLKNGSVIKGIIIEQTPNESLKIKTAGGSIYVFYMDEVEKITKQLIQNRSRNGYYDNDDDYFYPNRRNRYNDYLLREGYRGFIDLNYSLGVGDNAVDRLEFTTSHGYQVNELFYIGVGAGINYFVDGDIVSVPIFANPRVDFPTGRICPFIDMKLGYTVSKYVKGFYFVPSAGVRFGLDNGCGINIGIGYTLQKAEVEYYYNGNYYNDGSETFGAVTIKLGFDF